MKRYLPLVLVMLMVAVASFSGSYYWQEGEMVQGTKINSALNEKADLTGTSGITAPWFRTNSSSTAVIIASSTISGGTWWELYQDLQGTGTYGFYNRTKTRADAYFNATGSWVYKNASVDFVTNANESFVSGEVIASFSTIGYSTMGGWDGGATFTAPLAGMYTVTVSGTVENPNADRWHLYLKVSTGQQLYLVGGSGITVNDHGFCGTQVLYLNAGTTFRVAAYNYGAAAFTIYGPVLNIAYIGGR